MYLTVDGCTILKARRRRTLSLHPAKVCTGYVEWETNIVLILHFLLVNIHLGLRYERDTRNCRRPGHQLVLDREQRADAHSVWLPGGHRGAATIPARVRTTHPGVAERETVRICGLAAVHANINITARLILIRTNMCFFSFPFHSNAALSFSSKVCYIKYREPSSVGVAQHLTNTVFIDRALIVVPCAEGEWSLFRSNKRTLKSRICLGGLAMTSH